MSRQADSPFRALLDYLWLVALAAAAGVYALVRLVLPGWLDESGLIPGGLTLSSVAWIAALPFVLLAAVALARLVARRRRHERRVRRASLKDLTWRQFERLIGEIYGRDGFSMVETPRRAEGGFDYLLARGPERWLVQCKHWQARKVSLRTVRELAGAVASRDASGGVVATRGRFTAPARAFAASSGIRLLDGAQLASELLAVSENPDLKDLRPGHGNEGGSPELPVCPQCGGDMIKRRATADGTGAAAFWACARNPDCEGYVPGE